MCIAFFDMHFAFRSGTDSYMPPEFLLNGTYEASQGTVWTLGILMYYLVTGCRPYQDAVQAVNQPYGPPTHLKDFSPGEILWGGNWASREIATFLVE